MESFDVIARTSIGDRLKTLFKPDITPRRLSYIQTLGDLLTVLHSQYLLNRPTVDRLKAHLPDDCERFVEERYVQLVQPVGDGGRNVYADMLNVEFNPPISATNQHTSPPTHHQHRHPSPGAPTAATSQLLVFQYERKKCDVYRRLAEELGKKWRDLGRELDVPEGRLDQIDDEHRGRTGDKVHAVLRAFEERTCGHMRQYQALLDGLELVRRRDLVRHVQRMVHDDRCDE